MVAIGHGTGWPVHKNMCAYLCMSVHECACVCVHACISRLCLFMCMCACMVFHRMRNSPKVISHGAMELPKGDSHEARACLTGLASQHLHGSFPLSA